MIQIDEPAIREGLPLREESERLPELGGRGLSAWPRRAPPRHPDPHPHVLLGLQRHHRGHHGDGRRRPRGRGGPLRDARPRRPPARPYPGESGLGVYDVHSPRVPGPEEIEALLRQAAGLPGGSALGQSRLRLEDEAMGRGATGAGRHGRGRPPAARGARRAGRLPSIHPGRHGRRTEMNKARFPLPSPAVSAASKAPRRPSGGAWRC